MIALFDEPPRVTIGDPDLAQGSRAGLLLGFERRSDTQMLEGLIVGEEGGLYLVPAQFLTIDFRYNVETDRFEDAHMPKGDQGG